jgi:dihydrofolate synthase/folylpolyglutamate synthase
MHTRSLTYDQAVALLSGLQKRGWRLGLDRMREFCRRAGLEGGLGERTGSPRYIHVAGTNGKGSVTANLQALLGGQGHVTGAYYSPYVYDLRERVQLGGNFIPKEEFVASVERLRPVSDNLLWTTYGGPTEFEFKTAVGFDYWQRAGADWVALEVGLGGRLDSTNVVEPACSVIVSIGWDHMNILGDTLGKIATEKAGTIKPGRPVVVGSLEPEAMEAVERIAEERGAPMWRFGKEITVELEAEGLKVITPNGEYRGLVPKLRGSMQEHNLALAVAAMDAAGAIEDPSNLAASLENVRLPGRFEVAEHQGQRVVLDGAHNPNAGENLVASLFIDEHPGEALTQYANPARFKEALADWVRERKESPRIVLLTGMVTGHEPEPFYRYIAPLVKDGVVCPVSFERSRDATELREEIAPLFEAPLEVQTNTRDALARTCDLAGPDDLVLVTGSFFVVGEVGNHLGLGGA